MFSGERFGRGIVTDGITTPIVNTSAYWFKNSNQLLDFKVLDRFLLSSVIYLVSGCSSHCLCDSLQEGRHTSYEYGRYGNPTTAVLEAKIRFVGSLQIPSPTLLLCFQCCIHH